MFLFKSVLICIFFLQQESHNQLMPPRLVVELSDDFPNRIDKHDSLIVFVRHRGGAKNWHLPSITKHGKKYLCYLHYY